MANVSNSTTATYVERGWGQVEPNHLSAQRTGQIYAQLPAATGIAVLENGQFVKYDYANGVVTTSAAAPGEWMLVYNEVKVYRDGQGDADFAMKREDYKARIYSPRNGDGVKEQMTAERKYSGTTTVSVWTKADGTVAYTQPADTTGWTSTTATIDIGVATPADPYEWDSTTAPFAAMYDYPGPKRMPAGTRMVPRVFKTNVGDIFTTNTIAATTATVGETFAPANGGYLTSTTSADMLWEAVKLYDLADGQKAVKLMRIK